MRGMNTNNLFRVGEWWKALGEIVGVVPLERFTEDVLKPFSTQTNAGDMAMYQAMQMMQSLDVCDKPTAVHVLHFDLIGSYARLLCLALRNDNGSIFPILLRQHVLHYSAQYSQSTPRASHAASTSGPAGPRYIFSRKNVPLKRTVCHPGFTSLTSGAYFPSTRFQLQGISYLQYCEICLKQLSSVAFTYTSLLKFHHAAIIAMTHTQLVNALALTMRQTFRL